MSRSRSSRDATRELIERLCSDRQRPFESLARDLAEIHFLERDQRSEYVSNTQVAPPWRFGKLMLEYAVKARRLDEILGALTKDYCATCCDRLPVGCCSIQGYDMGLVPDGMLELQEIEARQFGWCAPEREEKCKYHGEAGCVLRLFKSPACIGMLCDPLVGDLAARFDSSRLDPFLERLAVFRNCDIDRAQIFEAMDRVIAAGEDLLRR